MVVVVDALDECEFDADIKVIIGLFSSITAGGQPSRIKVLLTSRPELPPRVGFYAIAGAYQDVILHDMPEPVVERDILTFLEYELVRIQEDYNASVPADRQLSSDWPKKSDIKLRWQRHSLSLLRLYAALLQVENTGTPRSNLLKS